MSIDHVALAAGSIRLASGISFLVDPVRANRLWGDPEEPAATARLLLRSMGYRDALIGGLLARAALRGMDTRGWFLASAGADAADLLGGVSVHHEMRRSQRFIGLGGAVVGIGVGLWGAMRQTTRTPATRAGSAPRAIRRIDRRGPGGASDRSCRPAIAVAGRRHAR